MKVSERYKKWLSLKAWWNCFRISVALIVIAGLLESANLILLSTVDPVWLKGLFVIAMAFVFSIIIWVLALVSPELMENIFEMLGFREGEEKKDSKK